MYVSNLNTLACANKVNIIWVPGHSGIFGKEGANELVNIEGLLDTVIPG